MIKKSMTLIFLLACIFLILAGQAFADSTVKYGDLNGDTKINSTDYSLLKRYVTNAAEFTPLQITASDLNADGKVNSTDVSLLKRKILGMIDIFPAEKNQINLSTASGIGIQSYDAENKTIVLDSFVGGKLVYKYADGVDPEGKKYDKVSIDYKDGVIYALRDITTVDVGYIKTVDSAKGSGDNVKTILLSTFQQVYTSKEINLDNVVLKLNGDTLYTNDLSKLIGTYSKVYTANNAVYRIESFNLGYHGGIISQLGSSYIKYQGYHRNDYYFSFTGDRDFNVFIDGIPRTFADLKPDMLFKAWVSIDGGDVVIAASTKKASGMLTNFSGETVVIGNTTYNIYTIYTDGSYSYGIDYISYDNGVNYNKESLIGLVNIDVVGYIGLDGNIFFIKGLSPSLTESFIGLVKSLRIEGQSIAIERDIEGVSTEVLYPVKTDSDDLNGMNNPWNNLSGSAISWATFLRDQGNVAGDKTGLDSLSAEKRIYRFTANSSNQIIKIQRLSFGDVGSVPGNLAGEGMAYTVTNFNSDCDSIEMANNLSSSLNKNLYVDDTVFFDLKAGKAVYWKDIEGQNSLTSKIAWSLKANGYLDAVAFLDDTYKNVTNQNYECYKYVTGEIYDGQCYYLVTYGDSTVKLYGENVTSEEFRQLDNDFIGYVKDGEG
ncbi:MAG TPA: dockerin type I repeat-containing protein, partial [Clostridia bacterium]